MCLRGERVFFCFWFVFPTAQTIISERLFNGRETFDQFVGSRALVDSIFLFCFITFLYLFLRVCRCFVVIFAKTEIQPAVLFRHSGIHRNTYRKKKRECCNKINFYWLPTAFFLFRRCPGGV